MRVKTFTLFIKSLAFSSALFLALPLSSHAFEVEGYKFEEKITQEGSNLVLNGVADSSLLSSKAAYVGLYVPQKQNSYEAIAAQKGAKLLVVLPVRTILTKDFSTVIMDRMRSNSSEDEIIANLNNIVELGNVFVSPPKVFKTDQLTIEWSPQKQATIFRYNGQLLGKPIPGESFFNMMLKVFIGPKAKTNVRNLLLGITTK